MKILLCSIYSPDSLDGVSNSTRQLVYQLTDKDVEVTVYTTDIGWDKNIHKREIENVKIFKALCNNNLELSFEMIKSLEKEIEKYDLVHFNSIYSLATVIGSYIARSKGVPYLLSPRGNIVPFCLKYSLRSSLKKKLFFKLFSHHALSKADAIVCTSENEVASFKKLIKTSNIVSINNGIDAHPYLSNIDNEGGMEKLGISDDNDVFLFLGRLAK